MAINALTKLSAEISDLPVQNMDGSPMLDDGKPVTATCFGPGSKIWQVADANKRRKAMRRVRENNGKLEAAADDTEDTIEFLCAITKRFNGLEIEGEADQVRAIYSNPLLGYIRDQFADKTRNWENFTQASRSNTSFTSDKSPT
jgi:hypothetical protein